MDFEVIAEGLQFPVGPIAMRDGSVLLVEIRSRHAHPRVGTDGNVTVVAELLGGGPNEPPSVPDGRVYVCNNGGSSGTSARGRHGGPRQPAPRKPTNRQHSSTSNLASGRVDGVLDPSPDR